MSNQQTSYPFNFRILRQNENFIELVINEDKDLLPNYVRILRDGSVTIQSDPFESGHNVLERWNLGPLDYWIDLFQELKKVENEWRKS